jgi:hypothetical protein
LGITGVLLCRAELTERLSAAEVCLGVDVEDFASVIAIVPAPLSWKLPGRQRTPTDRRTGEDQSTRRYHESRFNSGFAAAKREGGLLNR